MAVTEESDEALARRARDDRGAAFEAMLRRAGEILDAMLPRRLGGRLKARYGASDVRQDVLISVAAHFDRFEARGPGSFERWVRTLAANHERSAARRHGSGRRDAGREVRIDDGGPELEAASSERSPSEVEAERQWLARLLAAIERESSTQAEAFRLVRIEDRTFVEAGVLLGKSADAVRKLVERAEAVLRREFGDDLDGFGGPARPSAQGPRSDPRGSSASPPDRPTGSPSP